MKREFSAVISLMLILTMTVTLFMVKEEQAKKDKKVETEKELVIECVHKLDMYCKNKKEKGEIKEEMCPSVKGFYTCKNGLANFTAFSENTAFKYSDGVGDYE